jgi:2-haloacid dehalogenase
MNMNRRVFLAAGGALFGTSALAGMVGGRRPLKAILFDAFPVFDAGGVGVLANQLFPDSGLTGAWRARQFEYTWLRTIVGNYADFFTVTGEALDYAAESLGLRMGEKERGLLMEAFFSLKIWPDVPDALRELKGAGYRLGFLSNFTPEMLKRNVDKCGLGGYFSDLLSVDAVGVYKPDARAYRLGMDVVGLGKKEILFVASAGWDACGASQFGYETFWVNRQGGAAERLGSPGYREGKDLNDLVGYLRSR